MSLTDWMGLAGICLLGALTPGASLLVISRHAASGGYRAGLKAAWAHAAAIGFWALLSAFGLAITLRSYPAAAAALNVGAGLYLLWLGWQTWQSTPVDTGRQAIPVRHRRAWADGALIGLLNPKVGLFFLAIFSPLLGSNADPGERAAAATMAALIDGLWYTLVVLAIGRVDWTQRLTSARAPLRLVTTAAFIAFAALALSSPLR